MDAWPAVFYRRCSIPCINVDSSAIRPPYRALRLAECLARPPPCAFLRHADPSALAEESLFVFLFSVVLEVSHMRYTRILAMSTCMLFNVVVF